MTEQTALEMYAYGYAMHVRSYNTDRELQADYLELSKSEFVKADDKRRYKNEYARYARNARKAAKQAKWYLDSIAERFGAEIAQRVENGETAESIIESLTAAEAANNTTNEGKEETMTATATTATTANTNDATRVYNLPPYGAMLEGYIPQLLNVNTNGNRKLKNDATTRFIIWNLPAVKTCPFRTAMCEKSCYARKAERVYPQVLPSRERNYEESLRATFVEDMIFTINSTIFDARGRMRKAYRGKQIVFRIHESGDFYNYEYTRKWLEIMRYYEDRIPQLTFVAYTKSISYLVQAAGFDCSTSAVERANNGYFIRNDLTVLQSNTGIDITDYLPVNFNPISSIWDDTRDYSRHITLAYNFKVYTALNAADFEARKTELTECTCENCATCSKCWNPAHRYIVVKIH